MTSEHRLRLADTLAARARETPAAAALHRGDETVSWAQLAEETARRSASLTEWARSHALPPSTILAQAGTAGQLANTLLACQWAGHPFLPLDPATAAAHWPRWQGFADAATPAPHLLPAEPRRADTALRNATPPIDTPALVIATSGSEGQPKGVLLSHSALAAAAAASATRIPLAAGDTWLNCLPLFHIGGLSIFWRCFASGAAVRLHEGFDAAKVWADIADGRATHVSLVPAMLARLLDTAGDAAPPATLRCALIGGAALSHALWRRARAAGWPLFVSYGMSETAAQLATLPPGDSWQEGLVGKPLPGMEIAIGSDGRIRVRGPQLMLGYLGAYAGGDDGKLSPLVDDGWLRTGDLGRIDADGGLHVLGRADDMLVSGGENIHPAEVEARLAACPGIADVAVTATRDPVWGDIVTALVVGAEASAVEDWSREHLPAKLRPRRTLVVDALPRNALGKLERKGLAALAQSLTAATSATARPAA